MQAHPDNQHKQTRQLFLKKPGNNLRRVRKINHEDVANQRLNTLYKIRQFEIIVENHRLGRKCIK